MADNKSKLYSIGQVSKLSSLPVQTIRYYSDLGVLPPSHVTEAGYRMYDRADVARLELIRTLRSLEFDLETIAKLLKGELTASKAIELHLQALELQFQSLKRQRTILQAVQKKGKGVSLAYLNRIQSLLKLTRLERENFLAEHLERGLKGIPRNEKVWQAAVLDLPEEMNERQLEAWLELAELVSDESFTQILTRQTQSYKEVTKGKALKVNFQPIFNRAIDALQTGYSPRDALSQKVVESWIKANAKLMNRNNTKAFAAFLLEYYEQNSDPRIERYWQLVAVLKNWPGTSPQAEAVKWLLEGLRWKVRKLEGLKV
jgi:DNA-binding transcriptional MerR regulator